MRYSNPVIGFGQFYREMTHVRKFMQALKQPREIQLAKLMSIIRANEQTVFGTKHKFERIHSLDQYQSLVPTSTYESLQPYITAAMNGERNQLTKEAPIMFATTSGTTGTPKYIPITPTHLQDYTHAFQIHNWALMNDNPKTPCVPQAKYLIFASNDCEGYTNAGIPYGAVSGLLRRRQSPLVQRYFALPHLVSRIKDVESKYYVILRLSLCQRIVAALSCNPSTLLLLADQMNENATDLLKDIFDGTLKAGRRPEKAIYDELLPYLKPDQKRARELSLLLDKRGELLPREVWPDLSVVSVWKGGPMPFYLERLPEKYGNMPIRDFGYMASEGRGSIPLSDEGAGGVTAITSHFFEFVPEEEMEQSNKRFLCADELEVGRRYYIHFTTAAGLYRYNINDLIAVTGFEQNTPIFQFVQKGMGVSSITGEKLTEEQICVALQQAKNELDLQDIEHCTFSVQLENPPRYVGYIESRQALPEALLAECATAVDRSLQMQNIEYKEKRASRRLNSPLLQTVPHGTFMRLRQKRVRDGAPEAQVKIPFLSSETNFKETIAAL
ncbi:MAG: GH3 auxin-responsive promoter family protein [Candidatus Obscuribacterales bacterium]|nr:GH3 auxin-responsive promoter family protein [Candidatus Obscuribacterales bacterium]